MGIFTTGSNDSRWIRLSAPGGVGTLIAERVTFTESLCTLFECEVSCLSEDGNLDFDELLGHHVTVDFELAIPGKSRFFDGRVAQVSLIGMSGRFFRYRLILRPWLWMLTRTTDCKIFQDKNVQDILEEVFADQPDADFEFQLTEYYPPRTYCVQYRESDYNFVNRLLEEEGIYYFFKHEKNKHTLVICDAVSAHESVGTVEFRPTQRAPRDGVAYVHELTVSRQIQPGAVAYRDYNFESPLTDMTARASIQREHAEAEHEVYDYPGEYTEPTQGEFVAAQRLKEIEVGFETINGRCDERSFPCGGLFDLSNFGRQALNREYLITSTRVIAVNNLVESGKQSQVPSYDCWFQVLDSQVPFRPARRTPIPVVKGPQTAVVVGPDGEEIFVDEFGRVKVQFHWDRYGQKDDQSSCWIRVSQAWAGKNWGWMTTPRIGQEVIVSFLEGNPDDPIITGRVYNADQMPPWELPANKTQSGILTRSSPDGSPSTANELRFEDKKGEELIYLHAEKNKSTHVENDDSEYIGHDQTIKVDHDQQIEVTNDQREIITNDQFLKVVQNRNVLIQQREDYVVDHGQVTAVGDFQELHVKGYQKVKLDAYRQEEIGGTLDSKVTGGNRTEDTTAGSESRTISADQTFVVGGNIQYGASNITCSATGGDITLGASGQAYLIGNKCSVISNSDIDLMGVANINMVSVGNNTTVYGQNASGYLGMADDFFAGIQSSTALSLSMGTFIGLALETKMAVSLGTVMGATLDSHLGPRVGMYSSTEVELAPVRMFGPGGGGGGGGPGASSLANISPKVVQAIMGVTAFISGFTSGRNAALTANQYQEAQSQLQQAARAAAAAGHTELAARLNSVAQDHTFTGAVTGDSIVGDAEGTGGDQLRDPSRGASDGHGGHQGQDVNPDGADSPEMQTPRPNSPGGDGQ